MGPSFLSNDMLNTRFYELGFADEPLILGEPEYSEYKIKDVVYDEPIPSVIDGCVAGKGRKWPDLMTTSNPGSGIFVYSARVVTTIEDEGLAGIEFHPVELTESENRKLRLKDAPKYFWGKIMGKMAAKIIGRDGCSIEPDVDTGIHQPKGIEDVYHSYELSPESFWDGSDFFQMSTVISGHRFCTQRVLDAARRHRWTNFSFGMLADGKMLKAGVILGTAAY